MVLTDVGTKKKPEPLRGLTSRGGRNLRLPLRFGLRPQGPCRVGTGESGLVLSEEGNPAGLSSCSGGLRPLVELCVEPAGLCGRCTGVAVPLRVVPSPTGLPSKRGPGLGSFSRADRGIGGVRPVAPPTWLISNFLVRPASIAFLAAGVGRHWLFRAWNVVVGGSNWWKKQILFFSFCVFMVRFVFSHSGGCYRGRRRCGINTPPCYTGVCLHTFTRGISRRVRELEVIG